MDTQSAERMSERQDVATARREHEPVPIAVAGSADDDTNGRMAEVRRILEAAGARVAFDPIRIEGGPSGIPEAAWETIARHRVLLLDPGADDRTRPFPSGVLSSALGLFATVRSIRGEPPTSGPSALATDLVIVSAERSGSNRAYRPTPEVVETVDRSDAPSMERLIRYAFELALVQNRSSVHCVIDAEAGGATSCQLRDALDRVAADDPAIESEVLPAGIAAARLLAQSGDAGVIVAPGAIGDMLGRIAAHRSGLPAAQSIARIGERFAVFEPARDPARTPGMAGLLLAAVDLLSFIGDASTARTIHNAWLTARSEGLRDDEAPGPSERSAFAAAVIERLGRRPGPDLHCKLAPLPRLGQIGWPRAPKRPLKALRGVDVVLDWDTNDRNPAVLARRLESVASDSPFELDRLTNGGVQLYPPLAPRLAGVHRTDCWSAGFSMPDGQDAAHGHVLALLARIEAAGLDFVEIRNRYDYD